MIEYMKAKEIESFKIGNKDVHIVAIEGDFRHFIPVSEVADGFGYSSNKQVRNYVSAWWEIQKEYVPYYIIGTDKNKYGKGIISIAGVESIASKCQAKKTSKNFLLKVSSANDILIKRKEEEFKKMLDSTSQENIVKALAMYLFSVDEEKLIQIVKTFSEGGGYID